MSILDIKRDVNQKQVWKTVFIYAALSALAVIVNKVYAVFGHGVSSAYMTWMFLFPLIGGALLYLLLGLLIPKVTRLNGYRLFYNIYNSGIALLFLACLAKGIFEIAGTSSIYVTVYFVAGGVFIAGGLCILLLLALNAGNDPKRIS